MKVLQLGSKFDIGETRNKIEQTQRELEALVNSEDSSSGVMQDFKEKVDQINQIIFELHAEDNTDFDVLLQKSNKLKRIGDLLVEAASQYQESFSEVLFQQVKHWGLWFQGTGKEYEIHALAKQALEPTEQEVIQFVELITDFIENHWETHPEKILEQEEFALQLVEADKAGMSTKFREVSQKFIHTALSAAEKVKLKEIKSSSRSAKQLLDWAMNCPGWQGDDFESCLEIAKKSRIQAEF